MELFRSGQLDRELGIPVTEVSWLGAHHEVGPEPPEPNPAKREIAQDQPPPRIRILFLTANPSLTPRLWLDEEVRQITNRIRGSRYRDSLELISRWAVRPDDLVQALMENRPHIVHFSGHGTGTEELVLNDSQGNPKPVSKAALVSLFRSLKDEVQVVFLNACSSQPQAEAIAQNIDCVIGMKETVSDDAAIVFSSSFYEALGYGLSVKQAFDVGRTALLLQGIPGDTTPELLTREGVDPSALILVSTE
jgi:hypothetical protein